MNHLVPIDLIVGCALPCLVGRCVRSVFFVFALCVCVCVVCVCVCACVRVCVAFLRVCASLIGGKAHPILECKCVRGWVCVCVLCGWVGGVCMCVCAGVVGCAGVMRVCVSVSGGKVRAIGG